MEAVYFINYKVLMKFSKNVFSKHLQRAWHENNKPVFIFPKLRKMFILFLLLLNERDNHLITVHQVLLKMSSFSNGTKTHTPNLKILIKMIVSSDSIHNLRSESPLGYCHWWLWCYNMTELVNSPFWELIFQ